METIKYKRKRWACITPCPNEKKSEYGSIIYVGSKACSDCKHCRVYDEKLKRVICDFKDDIKRRINDMKNNTIVVPEGVRKIVIEIGRGRADYGIICSMPYRSAITGEVEENPKPGDLAIMYNEDDRINAIIAKVQDWNFDESTMIYKGAGNWYGHAIRFRNGEQYKMIIGDDTEG